MRYLRFIFLGFLIINIIGCSSKIQDQNSITKVNKNHLEINSENEEDDFLDEFDEELQIEKSSDPFSGYNRMMTSFNDGLYEYILSPTAKGYRYIVHKEIRTSVDNFFHNLLFPIRFTNNLLQGKFKNTLEETSRFLINSTVGILGLFDPAKSYFDLNEHNEDFGQTLGFYGVGTGPHIVLPLIGPSNLRDALSLYPDALINPIQYNESRSYNLTNNYAESILVTLYERENFVSLHDKEYETIKKDAVDLYPFLRDIYEQRRINQIKE